MTHHPQYNIDPDFEKIGSSHCFNNTAPHGGLNLAVLIETCNSLLAKAKWRYQY